MDYREVLRLLAINDEHFAEECVTGVGDELSSSIRRRWHWSALGALVAVGGAVPSYGAEADAAVSAGATAAEIVEVLVGVVSVVGLPSVVAAAPSLALALGYDINDALEQPGSMISATRRAGRPPSPVAPRRYVRRRPVSDRSSRLRS